MAPKLRAVQHVIPGQHIRENYNAIRDQNGEVQIVVNQYIPREQTQPLPENALTVIGLHAVGFPKECYEPLWEDIYARLCDSGIHVRGFWVADCSTHGASGVLNEDLNGDSAHWFDHSRDLLHMVNHFRREMPQPICGVAHSMGCAQLVHLSILHPRLLSGIILYEPIIFDTAGTQGFPHPSILSTIRRDVWPTREAAEASLRKGFNKMDPRVLDLYLTYGLRNLPTAIYKPGDVIPVSTGRPTKAGQNKPKPEPVALPPTAVTLTTTKHQEAWAYADLNMDTEDAGLDRLLRPDWHPEEEWPRRTGRPECSLALKELEHVRPPLLFVFGGKSPFSTPQAQELKLKVTGSARGGSGGAAVGAVEEAVMKQAGHLIPFENVTEAAEIGSAWLGKQLREWEQKQTILRNHDSKKSENGAMLKVSKEWIETTRIPADTPRPRQGKL